MEENSTPHPDYIKGFNDGYLLAKHMPELSDKLPSDLGKSERSVGFAAGKEQFILEQKKDRYPSWLQKDRLSNLDKEQKEDKDNRDKDI